ncbi:unnamed protein product [Amaranthus hypochondriacus]
MSEIDHYLVLGLSSGEEGAKFTEKDIAKAYRKKALELHPDKTKDPDAPAKFQNLQISYEILKNPSSRKEFDELLRIRREKLVRSTQYDAKRRKMMSDLERREKESFFDPEKKARDDEERTMKKLAEEIARIRSMLEKKTNTPKETKTEDVNVGGGVELDKSRVLKVSWEKVFSDYSSSRLRDLFKEFGNVEDIVIKSSKKKGSALVVMESKESAEAATGVLIGDLSNPLLVLPLQPVNQVPSVRAQEPVVRNEVPLGKVVGAGFQAFEDSVLDKLRKAAEKQKLDKREM